MSLFAGKSTFDTGKITEAASFNLESCGQLFPESHISEGTF